jgi:hypothetical protein
MGEGVTKMNDKKELICTLAKAVPCRLRSYERGCDMQDYTPYGRCEHALAPFVIDQNDQNPTKQPETDIPEIGVLEFDNNTLEGRSCILGHGRG